MENTKEQIFEKVQKIINDKNNIDLHEIKLESNVIDLAMDSLDMVELCIEIEKEFDISVSDSYVENWNTVENIVNDIMILTEQ